MISTRVRTVALVAFLIFTGCGATSASANKPTPAVTPTPTLLYIAALYTTAINQLHDSTATDDAAYSASKQGSAEASAAADKLAADYQTLLSALDAIPFPSRAATDLAAFRKAVVAEQVFWSNVSIDDSMYSSFTDANLVDAYNQTSILLGHDVGVLLEIDKPSPTPR